MEIRLAILGWALFLMTACTDAGTTSAVPNPSVIPSAAAEPSLTEATASPSPSVSYTEVHIRSNTVQIPLDVPVTDAVRFEVNNYDPQQPFSVRSPSGEEFHPDQSGIVGNQQVVFVTAPEPGVWTLMMEPRPFPQLVRIAAIPVNVPEFPVAVLSVTPTGQQTVTFDSSGSYDPDGTIVSVLWSLGDGTYVEDRSGSHTYAAPGNYLVTLEVEDDEGFRGFDFSDVAVP